MKYKQHTLEEIQLLMEHYCAYQDRCHQEVEQKLLDYQVYNNDKEQIIVHLITHNFLNEERFAKSFVRGKFNIKHWGRNKIKLALKQRNISTFLIDVGLKEIDENDYLTILSKEMDKKLNSITEKDPWKRKKKIVDYLMQKGYEYSLIEQVWNGILSTSLGLQK
ncbi:MAG: regulatory protein RecX [Flavobacteriaceae bacterium]|nr:regulatory protein RecX [Flavobacteriaceae bacterium]